MSLAEDLLDLCLLLLRIVWAYLEVVYRFFVPHPYKNVKEQVIVITGSGHGLGREMALLFTKLGAKLALLDVNKVSL